MILDPNRGATARLPDGPPLVCVVVDTEEEFDWSRPHDRASTGVHNIRHQERAHRVFERHGVRPTYVIDYPVASQADGFGPLRDLARAGVCEIGAHLHPWVNPPHDEAVTYANSYPGNLPPALEEAKLRVLTETIGANFGAASTVYRAGRYGVGPATGGALERLGYTVDSSVVHGVDFSADSGPDFTRCGAAPYWFGAARPILEVPLTHGFVGPLGRWALGRYRALFGGAGRALRLPGILSRAGLAERIRLSPEGASAADMIRLADCLIARGERILMVSYHSPSLEPGHTPYVRTADDLADFLDRIDRFLDHALGSLGGRPTTLAGIRALVTPPTA